MKVQYYYEGCYVDTVENFKNKRVAFISGTQDGLELTYVDDNHIKIVIHKYGLDIIGIKF